MPHLTPDETSLLNVFLDRIVPADDFPGAVEAGVGQYVQERFQADPATVEVYRTGLILLQTHRLSEMKTDEQDALIAELEGNSSIAIMIAQALEGYYSGIDSVGAKLVGFRVTA